MHFEPKILRQRELEDSQAERRGCRPLICNIRLSTGVPVFVRRDVGLRLLRWPHFLRRIELYWLAYSSPLQTILTFVYILTLKVFQ